MGNAWSLTSAAAMAVWLLCYGMIMLVTRPGRPAAPPPGPAGSALPSSIPAPALAALLCQGSGRAPHTGPAATLLDLVARGVLTVARDGAGRQWFRAGTVMPAGAARSAVFLSFERLVLDRVLTRVEAGSGAVPAAGLPLASGGPARRWHAAFHGRVVAEARRLGLVAERASWPVRALLRVALLLPAGLAAGAAVTSHHPWTVCYVVFGYAGATLAVRPLRRVVPRGAGASVAAACGAFRTGLAHRPPAGGAAASGDRRPAYAMAFGLTRAASPFEPDGDVVWSPCSGRWLRVVSGSPALGTSPAVALISLVPAVLCCAVWTVPLGYFTWRLTWDRIGQVWPVLLLGLGWALWATGTFRFLRWLGRTVSDLVTPPRIIVGPVVQLASSGSADRFSVAVDDGIADRVTRYPVERELYDRLRHGSWLRLEVRRAVGSVVRADVIPH